jgi:hypothetical protein
MRCGHCEPDYCACADFYAGRMAFWKGEIMPEADECPCAACQADIARTDVVELVEAAARALHELDAVIALVSHQITFADMGKVAERLRAALAKVQQP